MVRQRHTPSNQQKQQQQQNRKDAEASSMAPENNGLVVGGGGGAWSTRSQWIFFAIASGACAAFNGVFAKLTTTSLTSNLSSSIAGAFGLSEHENIVEVIVRGMFFVLNLTFNGVMWTLFTTALAKGTSTTQVSILNTSTNFVITALLGLAIFSESLPPLWWAGAALLVAGSVIVGRKDEGDKDAGAGVAVAGGDAGAYEAVRQRDEDGYGSKDDEDEDVIDLGDLSSDNRGR